ncbi:MAG: S-adenosylmethionine decarboxylase [Actinomycetota bacterium]|jgi:S-adenosylmethionine decarboxylase|nr:S-adenosylmethionine decarboxylase [Actinomycetota bacterium]MDP1877800.1 S-adenosylmethionine decarboxylase [Actinomycetota bacterium]
MTSTAWSPLLPSVLDDEMEDLAPEIYRQRLVVEGLVDEPITAEQITTYLSQLSGVLDMVTLLEPVTHSSPMYGWAGWIHWETSGAHFYAWDQPRLFFSVDIYTCKWFSNEEAAEFTRSFFNAKKVVHRAF